MKVFPQHDSKIEKVFVEYYYFLFHTYQVYRPIIYTVTTGKAIVSLIGAAGSLNFDLEGVLKEVVLHKVYDNNTYKKVH